MLLLLIAGGLAALGLAATRFGEDSRDWSAGGPVHTWRQDGRLAEPRAAGLGARPAGGPRQAVRAAVLAIVGV